MMGEISFKVFHIGIFLLLVVMAGLLSACSAQDFQPLSFQPELFTKQDQTGDDQECILLVGDVNVSFADNNLNDARIQVNGSMSAACSNLQVSMDQPDMVKRINVELSAATSKASGGSDRPFTVELVARSLLYGKYTVWVNGVAETTFSVK